MSEGTRAGNAQAHHAFSRAAADVKSVSTLVIRERRSLGHINLRGDPDDAIFIAGATKVLGLPLPTLPNTVSGGDGTVVYWLGPSEWLVVVSSDQEQFIAAALRDALNDRFSSVVEVTGGQVVLHLTGARVRAVLSKGCPLDLHETAFGLGQCAQSHLAKAPVLLRALADGVEVVVRRSYLHYVRQWLEAEEEH